MNTSTIEPTAGAQRLSRPRSAVAAAVGFAGLAGFELALALGAPLGRAATGGTHTYLPAGLRIASGLLTIFWALAALLILRRAGYRVPVFSARVARAGTWALGVLLTLGVLMNLASSSDWERSLQAPIAAVMAALRFRAARSGHTP
jgi:hypothetical protein